MLLPLMEGGLIPHFLWVVVLGGLFSMGILPAMSFSGASWLLCPPLGGVDRFSILWGRLLSPVVFLRWFLHLSMRPRPGA